MRVLELSLRNYRVFEEVELELPARVIGIFGPNGAGKSALVESIGFGLYGVDAARTKKQEIRTQGVGTDCEVRVVFEHGGRQYEVRRSIRGRGHAPDAELYDGGLRLATGTSDVDAEIRRLLHMDLPVFRASAFAEQKQLDAFSDVTKGKRKEMVLRLLGIRPVDEARTAARRAAREQSATASRLAGSIPDVGELEARVTALVAVVDQASAAAEAAAVALAEADDRASEAEAAFTESDAVRQRHEQIAIERAAAAEQAEKAQARRAELAERIEARRAALEEEPALREEAARLEGSRDRLAEGREVARLAEDRAKAEAALAELPDEDPAAAIAELEAVRSALDAARTAAAKAEGAADRAGGDRAAAEEAVARAAEADPALPCPTCGRPLGDDFAEYVRHCKARLAEAKKEETAARTDQKRAGRALVEAEREMSGAMKRGDAVRQSVDRRRLLAERSEELAAALAPLLERFDGGVPDLAALAEDASLEVSVGKRLAELDAERRRLEDAERDLESCENEVEASGRRIAELDAEEGRLAFDAEEHARRRKEREESRALLEQARTDERSATAMLGEARRELGEAEGRLTQARETAAAAEELFDEARVLERVGMLLDGFRDHLVARVGPELSREAEALFRELTNGAYEDLRIDEETMAIQIADGADWFPVERFSGSETDLANLALRVAISMHLSRVSGADVGLLILDEVLASLDAERRDRFVQAIGGLAQRFHQLLVITHADQVKDQFPAVIEVRPTGRRRSQAILV